MSATIIDQYQNSVDSAQVDPTQKIFTRAHTQTGAGKDVNVTQRESVVAPAREAANDPARPVLPKPTVDPSDEATFFGQYNSVMSQLDALSEGAAIDPVQFERLQSHLKQMQNRLHSSDEGMSLEHMLIAVLAIMNEMRSALKQISVTDLNHQNVQIKEKNDEKLQEILTSLEAAAKAKQGNKFSKAFGWLATAAAAVFLGATILASGGASTPAVIAGITFAVTLLMQVDAEFLEGQMMEKGFSWMGDKGPEIMAYVLMAATMAASLYGVVHAAGGFAKVMSNAKQLGPNLMKAMGGGADDAANTGKNALQVATENLGKNEQRLGKINAELYKYSTYVGLGADTAKSGTEMKVAVHEKAAELARADLKEIQASLRMLEEMVAIVSDMLKTLNESEKASAQFVAEVVKMVKDAKVHTSRAIS